MTRDLAVAMSFDVEEWFHTAVARRALGEAADYPGRIGLVMPRILSSLDRHGAKATFFVLGSLLETNAALWPGLLAGGHELACHGWDHRPLSQMDAHGLEQDLGRCLGAWERLALPRPSGYRAPCFGVVAENAGWVAEVLSANGFAYDSSVFPIARSGYGMPGSPVVPYPLAGDGSALMEMPVAAAGPEGRRIPAGGGAWMRFMPGPVHRAILRSMCRGGMVPVLYSHPWEYDAPFGGEDVRFPALSRIRQCHGGGRRMMRLLERILEGFGSVTVLSALTGAREG